ncbi:unnamed protein product [Ascophyllum nodosum]
MVPTARFSVYRVVVGIVLTCLNPASAFLTSASAGGRLTRYQASSNVGLKSASTMVYASTSTLKSKILQLAAVMDRGGMANKGVSNAYLGSRDDMRQLVDNLAQLEPVEKPILSAQLSGKWELLYTTVELFRASPFFQMVEAGYNDPEKSNQFFKLHQLQTGSWGISRIGRITQVVDLVDPAEPSSGPEGSVKTVDIKGGGGEETTIVIAQERGVNGSLESEVDLILLPLTSLPVIGFWKLLPTFGGCISTRAHCSLKGDNNEIVELVVESTKLKAVEDVPLLPVAGPFFEGREFPTAQVTKQVLGSVPVTKQTVVYIDDDLRVMRDEAGELFIYSRFDGPTDRNEGGPL